MTDYSDGHARQLEDILEDLSAGRSTVQEAAEWIRRQSPQMLHRPVKRRPKGIGVVITTVGFVFLAMAGIVGAQSYQVVTNGVKAQATVIEMIRRDRVQVPRFEFVVDGATYTGVANVGTNPPAYQVGDQVEVEFPADQPAQARIASWAERWTGTLALSVMGGIVLVIGVVIMLLTRRA